MLNNCCMVLLLPDVFYPEKKTSSPNNKPLTNQFHTLNKATAQPKIRPTNLTPSTNRATDQPTNQATELPTKPMSDQPTPHPNQPSCRQTHKPTNRAADKPPKLKKWGESELHGWCQFAAYLPPICRLFAASGRPHFFNFVRHHRKIHMARLGRKLARHTGLPVNQKL